MKIRYETTTDDLIAFSRYHYAHAHARLGTWLMLIFLLIVVVVLFCYLLYFFVLAENRPPVDPMFWPGATIICLAIVALTYGVIVTSRPFLRWSIERNVQRLVADGAYRTALGWYELELADSRLVIRGELTDLIMDLRAICRIVGTDEYTFVYTSSQHAFIIPMDRYPEAEYREFREVVGELREAWENRGLPAKTNKGPAVSESVEDRITRRFRDSIR